MARDSVSNDTLTVGNADTTHSWRVVTRSNLVYNPGALSPLRVTTNQQVPFTLRLLNTGQAFAYLLPDSTILGLDTLEIATDTTYLIPGNTSRDVIFPTTPLGLSQGSYPPTFDYDYLENQALYEDSSVTITDNVLVDNAVSLDTTSTSYPRLISQNDTLPIDITIQNAALSASAQIDSIGIPELNYQLPVGVTVPGGEHISENPRTFYYQCGCAQLNSPILLAGCQQRYFRFYRFCTADR